MKAIFNGLDLIHDGYLTVDDYIQFAERMISLQTDDTNKDKIRQTCIQMFCAVSGDNSASEDTKVSFDVFLKNAAISSANREETEGIVGDFF